jgi:uncharacterized protein YdaU (DUF1376 family)
MHYFQFNIGDYASHTRHLSLMEDLAYRRMLDSYYLRETALPEDAAEVARLIGMRDHISEVEQVLADFFSLGNEGWRHDRADAEIAHFRDKSAKASNAGKVSAKRRLNKRSTNVQPTNNQEPITNNQDISPLPPKAVSKPDDVSDDVWRDFKKHRAKHGGITERVIAGFRREADRAGWTLEQAMDECITQGWRGFKAEYVKGRKDENRFASNSNTYRLAIEKLGLNPDG